MPTQPMETIAMDTIVMGAAANSTSAKFIQVAVDMHSRFVWATPTKRNTSRAIITLLDRIIASFGRPKRIITDQGRNFIGSELKKFLDSHEIGHSFISSYHPAANGLCERTNGTLSDSPTTRTA